MQLMPNDQTRPVATGRDVPRPDATGLDQEYSLTIEQAADIYAAAGHPRTPRTVQRYCAKGHLDCQKVPTLTGDVYRVAPYSVKRHIAQINEVIAFTSNATCRDLSRQVATGEPAQTPLFPTATHPTTDRDVSRQVAAQPELPAPTGKPEDSPQSDRYTAQLERENDFLRDQIKIKDGQIAELGTRARETNVLIKGLQDLFLALNPGRSHRDDRRDAPNDRFRERDLNDSASADAA